MIAYEVSVNGKRVATAGVENGVVVAAIANILTRPSGEEEEKPGYFSLGGLDSATGEHIDWFKAGVRGGDEITIRMVEVESGDAPIRRRPSREALPGRKPAG